jgi:hypothetical protein
MGLKDLFKRWTKAEDERALERAERESSMTPVEREVDQEDYEARKDDIRIAGSFQGSEALDASRDELED